MAGEETTVSEPQESRAVEKQSDGVPDSPSGSPLPETSQARSHLEWNVPLSVPLPIEVLSADQPFPFLDTTLADLGIQESAVKEKVVWVDTKKTQVKNKAGKLKEREVTILEVRVTAQNPGDKQTQQVLYSTESHTDRSFCRTRVDILPWIHTHTEENGLQPIEMTMALEVENQQPESDAAREV
ncbi:uncharacterized protein si:ch211-196f5.2 [Hypomesus transpacificus]|uniref:uncharacterized protein si:ch211-196f5.2 n=1 Tax=Hypomesus transpacificus TaxID=137520 RepID=UPI001F080985|nr:uncharacterized protein si:ch211-196f5.2 [Hypomesus transpacificus]